MAKANYILWEIASQRLKNEGYTVAKTYDKLSCTYARAHWGNLWIREGKVSEKTCDSLIRKIRYAKAT